jgi:two-component system, chemotaxis family, response regulator Rcp1
MAKRVKEKTAEILIAEDDPQDIQLALEGLKASGLPHHVTVVRDGAEAMAVLSGKDQYASTPKPNLVLLDMNLPKKKGQEVLAEIKRDSALKHIPVVVWSTSRAPRSINEAYDSLANCYVVKPIGLERSIEVVREIVSFWLDTAELPTT